MATRHIILTDQQIDELPVWLKLNQMLDDPKYHYELAVYRDISDAFDIPNDWDDKQPVIIECGWRADVTYGLHGLSHHYQKVSDAPTAAKRLAEDYNCGDSLGRAQVKTFRLGAIWVPSDGTWQQVELWPTTTWEYSEPNHVWLISDCCDDKSATHNIRGCGMFPDNHRWVIQYDVGVGGITKIKSTCRNCGLCRIERTGFGGGSVVYDMPDGHWCNECQKWDCSNHV